MNKNPATAAQLLALHTLEMKRLEPVADQDQIKEAVKSQDHPFWKLYEAAVATLVVVTEVTKEVTEEIKQTVKSVMKKIMEVATPAIGRKKTSDCFIDKTRYYDPDPDLRAWLPEIQSEQPEAKFLVNELTKASNFRGMVEEIVGEKENIKNLSQHFIQRRHTTTLPTIESLIERQEREEDVGLRMDGSANFFFVEDKDGGVSVVYVRRHGRRWNVYVSRLGSDVRWDVGHRVFIRNS
jgi:hypothetical protein